MPREMKKGAGLFWKQFAAPGRSRDFNPTVGRVLPAILALDSSVPVRTVASGVVVRYQATSQAWEKSRVRDIGVSIICSVIPHWTYDPVVQRRAGPEAAGWGFFQLLYPRIPAPAPEYTHARAPSKLAMMDQSAAPRDIYARSLTKRAGRLESARTSAQRIGYLRLLVFLGAAAIVWYIFHGLSPWWILAPIAAFVALVWRQARFERDAECAKRAIQFFERGMARLENRWQGGGEDGARFADPHHPYASDLDLFGRASLFELLSTARTRGGEQKLAEWLKSATSTAATADEIAARHEAVDELRPMLDLREQIAVLGDDYRAGVNPDRLVQWSSAPVRPFPAWVRILALVLALVTLAMLAWWMAAEFMSPDAELGLVAAAAVDGVFAFWLRKRVLAIVNSAEEPARDLELLSQLLATLEKQHFHSSMLAALRKMIDVDGHPASGRISRLRRLIEILDSRDNLLLRAIGPLVLWTTQTAMAIEAWRAKDAHYVPRWLDAISEIEALSSLANYAWEHPQDPFPQFCPSGEPHFEGEEMGHPLIADDKCVRNSVCLAAPLRMLVVSGSNMSGKSTLLRSIGVNTILAMAGAPVRAARLSLSFVSLGASIRTLDSLEEGYSRFMAEIMRLKQVLELPAPALFLLDELLGGTNSHDRELGARGLVDGLLERGAIGLLTTHDLALSRIADELAPVAANVHFEDRLENGRLVFDYRLRPGVVARSNALDLMRAVGLHIRTGYSGS